MVDSGVSEIQDMDASGNVVTPDGVAIPAGSYRPRAGSQIAVAGPPLAPKEVIPEGDPWPAKGSVALDSWRTEVNFEAQALKQHFAYTPESALDWVENLFRAAHHQFDSELDDMVPKLFAPSIKGTGDPAQDESVEWPSAKWLRAAMVVHFEDEIRSKLSTGITTMQPIAEGAEKPEVHKPTYWHRDELYAKYRELRDLQVRIGEVLEHRKIAAEEQALAERKREAGVPVATYGGTDNA